MRIIITLGLFFAASIFTGNAQQILVSSTPVDTLKSSYSTSKKLSEVDISAGISMSSFGVSSISPFLYNPLDVLFYGMPFQEDAKLNSLRYSSLPHIGLAYTFGSSGFQHGQFQYTQAFDKKWTINLDFINFQTNGILRNSGMKNQTVTFKVFKQWKKVESLLTSKLKSRLFEWNGGISNDSLPLTYTLDLIPVRKSDSQSIRKDVSIDLTNHFNLLSDSTHALGIFIKNGFTSRNRLFTETGDLASQYSTILVDSFETRDQLQISTLENECGGFLKKSTWSVHSGLIQRFWNFRNGSIYRDTLELGVKETFSLKLNSIVLNQKFEFFFLGQGSSWKNDLHLLKKLKNIEIGTNWKLENVLPELFQRHYFSNNIFYQLSSYDLQFKSKIEFDFNLKLKNFKIVGKAAHLFMKNPYIFNGVIWSNNVYNQMQLFHLQVMSSFNWKIFEFTPSYSLFALPSSLTFYPSHHVKLRASVQRGILKNRKLKTIFGMEPQFVGNYSPVIIYPNMDLFALTGSTVRQKGYLDLALFTGFELNGFRFFARAENLGYFWNNRMLQVVSGYPIPSMQIRLGITWDFWN